MGIVVSLFRRVATDPNQEDVSFSSLDKTLDLAGTLQWPPKNHDDSKPIPAAIFLHGSGPIDRHGNAVGSLLGGLAMNTHGRLAEHLTSKSGMAVLAYDKRGIGKSGQKRDYLRAGLHDLVDDAVAAYRYLVQHSSKRIDPNRIFVMGHSEGAIMLPLVARRIREAKLPPPKGLVFLAGYGDNLFAAMTNQRERIISEVEQSKGILGWILRLFLTRRRLEKQYNDLMKSVFEDYPDRDVISTKLGLAKTNAKWFREHKAWDAKEELRTSTAGLHCLALTGSKDVQVKSEYCNPKTSAELASPQVASLETHVIPNVTHILRAMGEDEEAKLLDAMKVYRRQAKQPIDATLLSKLDEWIQRILKE